jgi:hypothetical protein
MEGIELRSLIGELVKVDPEFEIKPAHSIVDVDNKLDFCHEYIAARFDNFTFAEQYRDLPIEAFRHFTFDEICKLKYSSNNMMDSSVEQLFESQVNYHVIRKIMGSMWRWGAGNGTWNEIVDAYNGIKHFSLGLNSDFEIRLDYTNGMNPFGYSRFCSTYLDGVFAFLVHYKGKHVMTISFSVMAGRRLLIQQVQLKQPFGNRWLYKFPPQRLEFVIDLFALYFPSFSHFVIDGKALTLKTITSYQQGLSSVEQWLEVFCVSNYIDPDTALAHRQKKETEAAHFRERVAHVTGEQKRLTSFYANCGRYKRGKTLVTNGIAHRELHQKRA